jgi:ABC-type multidrug transport system fused ATPase/permease subunit
MVRAELGRLAEGRELNLRGPADLASVLRQGKIVERGTHTQLLETDGTYAELYRQFVKR